MTKQLGPDDDIEELARFREEWKAEVRSKQAKLHPELKEAQAASSSDATTINAPPPGPSPVSPKITHEEPNIISPVKKAPREPEGPLPAKVAAALEVYRQAVAHEQRSQLNEALRLYRQAFRMDDNVDKVYQRLEALAYHRDTHSRGKAGHTHRKTSSGATVEGILHGIERMDVGGASTKVKLPPAAHHDIVTGTLAHLIAGWPSNVTFEREDEKQPVHLQALPEELLIHILQYLGTTALERFATVSRKARILTLDVSIWRDKVKAIYQPPQIPEDENYESLSYKYKGDFRRLFIEQPRVRLDGVYIAVCHYVRNGLSENAWINVTHLVTYHRYLRFYPNGEVLSLLTNEETAPQEVIRNLGSSLRMKGLSVGNWRLEGTTVCISDLIDTSGTPTRYSFQMVLDLRSRPLGRWNRLDFREYSSVEMSTGEMVSLPLKNDRPFWFSKVRSYTT